MLGSIRKFSTSIYAKILLVIIVIPFVFWGMGSSITGGNKNIVVSIDNEKYTIREFTNFINKNATKKIESIQIEELLSTFIGAKLIELEVEHYGIKLSNNSLAKLIKNQKMFKRDNKFSRTEYEKFLLMSNLTPVGFESILSNDEKKKQLLELIGGGIVSPNFLTEMTYNKINQKRDVSIINLNKAYLNDLVFSNSQIKEFFDNNKVKYSEIFKSFKMIELTPNKLIGKDEYNDLFFNKIDEIDDLINGGQNLDNIGKNFDYSKSKIIKINALGQDSNFQINKNIPKELIDKIFKFNESEFTSLIENNNKFYVVEIINTENLNRDINNAKVKENVLNDLKNKTRRQLIIQLIDKINKGKFSKLDFNKLAKDKNINIEKFKFSNANDDKVLEKEVVNQIYSFSEKKIIIVNDLSFTKNYLVRIDKINNVKINTNSEDYKEYSDLSRGKIVRDLYNTYDNYLKNKYKIEINYQALSIVKNYFN